LRDTVFRDDLLEVMAKTLALARALPLVQQMRGIHTSAPPRTGREIVSELRAQREALRANPSALRALDQFLEAAGIMNQLELAR
jgi:hypothetical protein